MSAVSNRVTPRSIARWITLREVSRSVRWPKLLQPRPTAETRRPEPPRLRICMIDARSLKGARSAEGRALWPACRGAARHQDTLETHHGTHGRSEQGTKKRPRSDAATDGDRLGRMIRDG